MTGNAGTVVTGGSNLGLTGLEGAYESSVGKLHTSDMTEIAAKGKTTVLFNFSTQESVEDELVNFSMNTVRQITSNKKNYKTFSIGIANISVN